MEPKGLVKEVLLRGGHKEKINRISWSYENSFISSVGQDGRVIVWNTKTGESVVHENRGLKVYCVSFSPLSPLLAYGLSDGKVKVWNYKSNEVQTLHSEHRRRVYSIAWSPKGDIVASGSQDRRVILWNIKQSFVQKKLIGHDDQVNSISWGSDDSLLFTGSDDGSVRVWEVGSGETLQKLSTNASKVVTSICWNSKKCLLAVSNSGGIINIYGQKKEEWSNAGWQNISTLLAHNSVISDVSFSSEGDFLVSNGLDNAIKFWNTKTWEEICMIEKGSSGAWFAGISFHPKTNQLATLCNYGLSIQTWTIDKSIFLSNSNDSTIIYRNAKVALLGDSGVGKTGLYNALLRKGWFETSSSHGREVELLKSRFKKNGTQQELREIFLWDLAGQPNYRLIHQLSLDSVDVAIIVFDSKSVSRPLDGVKYWLKAIENYRKESSNCEVVKILVQARVDRGKATLTSSAIKSLSIRAGIDEYFETSAKKDIGIKKLRSVVKKSISWKKLKLSSSTRVFFNLRVFLSEMRQTDHVITTKPDFYRHFLTRFGDRLEDDVLEFDNALGCLEAQGLIKNLTFGQLILIKEEVLDCYASSITMLSEADEDGLGCIAESKVLDGSLRFDEANVVKNKHQERLLLIATIEELLSKEIAFREKGDEGDLIVFPALQDRDHDGEIPFKEVVKCRYRFDGPIQNIYSVLIVRLAHSVLFKKDQLWKQVAVFSSKTGGFCGIRMNYKSEDTAEIEIFFSSDVSPESEMIFQDYVYSFLSRKAQNLKKELIYLCPRCKTRFANETITKRLELGFNWILCNVCDFDEKISLLSKDENKSDDSDEAIYSIDENAKINKISQANISTIKGKIESKDYDVFLCHNSSDKEKVKEIGGQLKKLGILPWLDEWETPPFKSWQEELQKVISQVKTVAVFVGKDGFGPWENLEIRAFLQEFTERGINIGMVLLNDFSGDFKSIPTLLKVFHYVDFRKLDPNPIEQLYWGITGRKLSDDLLTPIK